MSPSYTIHIAPEWSSPELEEWVSCIPDRFDDAPTLTVSNDQALKRMEFSTQAQSHSLVVKQFPGRNPVRSVAEDVQGPRAKRSFDAATQLRNAGCGSPEPVSWMVDTQSGDQWLVTRELEWVDTFKDRLVHIYRNTHDCEELISVLQTVADAVRAMHESGFIHGDLGNQNILLLQQPLEGQQEVQFVDLNRAKIVSACSLDARARDLSRIYLPSDFLRIFYEMIFEGRPPEAFLDLERKYRRRFELHTKSRKWRRPFREHRRSKKTSVLEYPPLRDIWIWDERSRQAITTLRKRERRKEISVRNSVQTLSSSLRHLPGVMVNLNTLKKTAFQNPVHMRNKVGLTLHITEDRWDQQNLLLHELGPMPVMIRFYYHDPLSRHTFIIEKARELSKRGFQISAALIQNREAVLAPDHWRGFTRRILNPLHTALHWVEVGHATNRVKWGLWSGHDYEMLADCVQMLREAYPDLAFTGPAGIDFEYHRVISSLSACKGEVYFDALSHHLYVDRRGAPENEQAGFSTWEKCAFAKAIAQAHKRTEGRFIVSEVNWPLLGTGVHSPVGSPYLYPGQVVEGPSVEENTYADYMIRYFLQAICSGMADQVYWWSLAAHGFGLVDDVRDVWKPRPAFYALKQWNQHMRHATFTGLRREKNVFNFGFNHDDMGSFNIMYAHPQPQPYDLEAKSRGTIQTLDGEALDRNHLHPLTGSPVYLFS